MKIRHANEYLIANIGVDKAEIEPLSVPSTIGCSKQQLHECSVCKTLHIYNYAVLFLPSPAEDTVPSLVANASCLVRSSDSESIRDLQRSKFTISNGKTIC